MPSEFERRYSLIVERRRHGGTHRAAMNPRDTAGDCPDTPSRVGRHFQRIPMRALYRQVRLEH
jgi:hypothetical protein